MLAHRARLQTSTLAPRSSMLDPRGSPTARRWAFFSQRRSAPLATRSTLNLGCGVVRSTCGLMWMGVFFADTGYRPKGHVSMESYLHEKSHAVRHAQRNTTHQSTTRNATERAIFEARPWHQTSATVTRQRAPLQPRVLKAKTAESSTRAAKSALTTQGAQSQDRGEFNARPQGTAHCWAALQPETPNALSNSQAAAFLNHNQGLGAALKRLRPQLEPN